jgi:predicted secreted hydrolase
MTQPVRIWIGDWNITRSAATDETWRLQADGAEFGIDLDLRASRPIIAQGDRGLSQKSAERGNASFYYSIPRFAASGRVIVGSDQHEVQGQAWFDHEWSTSALAEGQRGWDWFSLQLDDGREIMYYEIRDADGRANAASRGVIVNADGTTRDLLPGEIDRQVTAFWRSPATGTRYPAGWRMKIPDLHLDLSVAPRMPDQEWRTTFRYWEGAVTVSGEDNGSPVAGVGYVELVGY